MSKLHEENAASGALTALTLLGLAGACGGGVEESAWDPPVTIRPGEPDAARFERVVLVTVDTLRADHLASYGYFRETSPFLDRMGAGGVLFENALAPTSTTAPSHATMFTGLLPGDHGILINGWTLDGRLTTLAGMYAGLGFDTAAITSVRFLSKISAGFRTVSATERDARATVDEALRWLEDERRSDRFFLWVHLYDPHGWCLEESVVPKNLRLRDPLQPDAYDELARRHGLADGPLFDWGMEPEGLTEPESRERVLALIDYYDALIAHADAQLERLERAVSGLGLGATLWVITSDHGEGLGSHGYFSHAKHIYNEQLRVPLIVASSDGSLGPLRVDHLVQHVDLLPTLAELAGVSLEDPGGLLQGTSLVPLLEGRDWSSAGRMAFSQRRPVKAFQRSIGWLDGEVYSVQTKGLKYIQRSDRGGELFDLARDPLELRPLPFDEAGRALREHLEQTLERLGRGAPAQTEKVPDEILEELRALGYLGDE